MISQLAPVTDRVAFLRNDVLGRDIVGETPPLRTVLARHALGATVDQPQPMRIAIVLDKVCRGVPVKIRPRELLVGSRGADGYPELDEGMARGSAAQAFGSWRKGCGGPVGRE